MDTVLRSHAYSLDYLREQVADLSEDQLTMQPQGVLQHPAWIIGHLSYSCQAIGGELALKPWLPEDWQSRFGTGSLPMAGSANNPSRVILLDSLVDGQTRLANAIRRMSPDEWNLPLPDVRYRSMLPTIGHAVTQILVAHTAYHVGQLTVWRRLVGIPSVSRPFM